MLLLQYPWQVFEAYSYQQQQHIFGCRLKEYISVIIFAMYINELAIMYIHQFNIIICIPFDLQCWHT